MSPGEESKRQHEVDVRRNYLTVKLKNAVMTKLLENKKGRAPKLKDLLKNAIKVLKL